MLVRIEAAIGCCEDECEHSGSVNGEFLRQLKGHPAARTTKDAIMTCSGLAGHESSCSDFCVSHVTSELTDPSIRLSYFIIIVGNIVTKDHLLLK